MSKPKQRRKHQIAIKEMKDNLTESVISNIELRKQKLAQYTKLKKNKLDAVNYIKETCEWQEDVLVKIGYLSKDGEDKSCVTLMGRACSGINESDAFLTVEYLIQLFERFEANDTMSATMAFVLGTFIDERELNKEESDDGQSFREKFKTIVSDASVINNVEYELNELKNIYEKLASEERLRDASMKLTPDFGAYVYLWTIKEFSYSQLVEKLGGTLYEGNFVKNMLKVEGLTKHYNHHPVVDDLSFHCDAGEVLGFLGPNGAGKSTTMKMITGFVSPSAGTASICGHDIVNESLAAKQRLGYLPEGAPCYAEMTTESFLSFIAEIRGLNSVKDSLRLDELIERLHLGPVLAIHKMVPS